MTGRTARRRVLRVSAPGGVPPDPRADLLAVEEPLEIRVAGQPLSVTMRTPGDDLDLTAGFLAAEGIIAAPADLAGITMCAGNVAEVTLAPGVSLPLHQLRRNFLTSSACGVCGKDSIDAIRLRSRYDVSADPLRITPATLAGLPGRLRAAQRVFASTGGLHAAGVFQADGTLLVIREDVGRHNAVDKVIGWALRAAAAAGWLCAAGQRPGLVRADPESGDGWPASAGRGLGAILAGRRTGRGVRADPGRLPARRVDERVRGRAAGGRLNRLAGAVAAAPAGPARPRSRPPRSAAGPGR